MGLLSRINSSRDCLKQPTVVVVMEKVVVHRIIRDGRGDFGHKRYFLALPSFLPFQKRLAEAVVVVEVRP